MHDDAETICVRARIHGRVQGVWYRAWMEQTARAMALRGWVRNRTDGTVEAVICGPRDRVERLLERAYNGPPAARVDRIDTVEEPDPPGLDDFAILPTR